jgi:O-antigen/teichoic acid export membrane protein
MMAQDSSGSDQERSAAREQTQGALSRSVVLAGSKVTTWGLAFIMTIIMPRYLGATGYGRLYLAISLTGIMQILVEFGLNSLVAREATRRPEEARRYLRNAGALKAGLWVVALAIVGVVVQIAEYPAETQIAVAVLAVSVLVASQSSLIVAVLQANDRIRWIAVTTVVEKVVYVGLGVTVLVLGYGVLAVAIVMLVGSIGALLLDLWWLRSLSRQVDLRSGVESPGWRGLFRQALPFFAVLFFGAIYFRLDVVILSLLKTDSVVGFYGAAYRLFQTTYVLPDAFLFALFPLFCRLSPTPGDGLSMAAQKGLDLLLALGIPIAAGILVLSDEIVTTLYGGEYAESIPLLRVLAIAIVLMYANGVFVQLLIATERQGRLAVTAGVAAVANVAINLALIPYLGALGAAIATVATEALVIVMNFSFLPKSLTRRLRFVAIGKYLIAAAAMSGVLLLLNGRNLALLVPVGAAVYVVGIVVLRAVSQEDWEMLKSAFANVKAA